MKEDYMYQNAIELNDFVKYHNLMNRVSIIDFDAKVSIKTVKNTCQNQNVRVMIHLDGYNNYGRLQFIESELDTNLYPNDFDAKYQFFKHIDEVYFQIIGNHTLNSNIGEYEVKIVPLGRRRD
jgi:hypothetical protein